MRLVPMISHIPPQLFVNDHLLPPSNYHVSVLGLRIWTIDFGIELAWHEEIHFLRLYSKKKKLKIEQSIQNSSTELPIAKPTRLDRVHELLILIRIPRLTLSRKTVTQTVERRTICLKDFKLYQYMTCNEWTRRTPSCFATSTQSTVLFSLRTSETSSLSLVTSSAAHSLWLILGCLSPIQQTRQSVAVLLTDDASETLIRTECVGINRSCDWGFAYFFCNLCPVKTLDVVIQVYCRICQ